MPIFDRMSDKSTAAQQQAGSQQNGVGGDPVQAKLAALLDDVTVGPAEPRGTAAPLPNLNLQVGAKVTEASSKPEASSPPLPEVAQITAQIKSIQAAAERGTAESIKTTPHSPPLPPGAINIKGRSDGVAIEIDKGNWLDLLQHLDERLTQAAGFFRGGRVALDVGARPLLETELDQVLALLEQHGMKLGVVRTLAERTFEAAVTLGIAAKLETAEGATDAEIEAAESNWGNERHFVYRGNLRAGQVLERREHILVLGDVNPGAVVNSHGDILVWGRLRGIAQAGAGGDRQAVVLALHLEPVQLRIAGVIAVGDGQGARNGRRWLWKGVEKRPEIAYVAGEQIVIEPWDESKPGGLSAFRR